MLVGSAIVLVPVIVLRDKWVGTTALPILLSGYVGFRLLIKNTTNIGWFTALAAAAAVIAALGYRAGITQQRRTLGNLAEQHQGIRPSLNGDQLIRQVLIRSKTSIASAVPKLSTILALTGIILSAVLFVTDYNKMTRNRAHSTIMTGVVTPPLMMEPPVWFSKDTPT